MTRKPETNRTPAADHDNAFAAPNPACRVGVVSASSLPPGIGALSDATLNNSIKSIIASLKCFPNSHFWNHLGNSSPKMTQRQPRGRSLPTLITNPPWPPVRSPAAESDDASRAFSRSYLFGVPHPRDEYIYQLGIIVAGLAQHRRASTETQSQIRQLMSVPGVIALGSLT